MSRPIGKSERSDGLRVRSPVRGRVAAEWRQTQRFGITALGVLSFVCGALASVKINLVGEIYLGEIALIAVGAVAAASGGMRAALGSRTFWLLLLASFLTLAGYMLSDFVRGTAEAQYIRGWARTAFIISSFVALSLIFLTDKRNFWWFVSGLAIGGILYLKFVERLPIGANHHWKFVYSVPFTMLVASLAVVLPLKIVAVGMLSLGVFSTFSDYRIHGAVCLFIAVLLWAAGSGGIRRISAATLAKVGALAVVGLILALQIVGMTENEWTEKRRGSSDFTREVGIRFGLRAITESPVIGYGSWANSPELIVIADEEIRAQEQRSGRRWAAGYGRGFHSHSQLLQSWVEGGLLGAALFLTMAVLLVRELAYVVLRRAGDLITPALLFTLTFQLWHLVASPLGSSVRLFFALSMALVVLTTVERLSGRKALKSTKRGRLVTKHPPLIRQRMV